MYHPNLTPPVKYTAGFLLIFGSGFLHRQNLLLAMKLSEMKKGHAGTVQKIDSPSLEVVLMQYGLMVGDRIVVSDMAPFNGPVAVSIRGHKVALRRRDAEMVNVLPHSDSEK